MVTFTSFSPLVFDPPGQPSFPLVEILWGIIFNLSILTLLWKSFCVLGDFEKDDDADADTDESI